MKTSIPPSWQVCRLEACVEVLDALRVPVNNAERLARIEGKPTEDLYPYYGATGQTGVIDDFLFDEELVALGEDGVPFLDPMKPKAYMLQGKTWVNNHAHVLREVKGVSNNKFICHYLNQFDYQGYVNGGTRLKLTQASMRAIPIPLPSLAEQARIAQALDGLLAQVDTLKARLDALPALIKRFRQSVLSAAVSGNLTGSDVTKWRSLKASDVCSKVQSGGTPKKGFYESGVPFLKVYNIVNDHIDFDYKPQFASFESQKSEISKSVTYPGDVLMNIVGPPLGKIAIVPDDHPEWNINQAITLFRPSKEILSTWIAISLMGGEALKKVILETRGIAGQVNISLSQCRNFIFEVPPIEEQSKICLKVEQLFAFADQFEARLTDARARVDALTQSILAKAFRGELVPQDPTDEPASVLLERIKAQRTAAPKPKRGRKSI